MNKQISLLILLCVFIGCSSYKTEIDLLNKKNPTGIYGNFSSAEKKLELKQELLFEAAYS